MTPNQNYQNSNKVLDLFNLFEMVHLMGTFVSLIAKMSHLKTKHVP